MDRIWRDARSISDLGGVMAGWLEGHVADRPGFALNDPSRPDPETGELVPLLARLNRRGYLTTESQTALEQIGYAENWHQRAAVQGWIRRDDPLLIQIVRGARAARLLVSAHGAGRCVGPRRGFIVTRLDNDPRCGFGGRPGFLRYRSVLPGVGRRARRELRRDGVWLAVADPDWGQDGRLWDLLEGICAHGAHHDQWAGTS